MIVIHPQKIVGNWHSGVALDVHTNSSTYLGVNETGHDVYDTKRSEIGELLYRLKYNGDQAAAKDIVAAASKFLLPHRTKFDLIVPVPPSGTRAIQPVITLANGIGAAIGVPVTQCIRTTRATTQLKGVTDSDKRKELLAGLYMVDRGYTTGKNVLLFDDLFRSGSTMNAITDVLMQAGKAATVRVLTVTRTRSNQ
jgi:competence protein ComFC